MFLFPPEYIHRLVMGLLSGICRLPWGKKMIRYVFAGKWPSSYGRQILGIQFSNPVGMAAGFDKNAKWLDVLACLGFGFVEIGTVTPFPQPGNELPRLFRLPADQALVNRMGFNNDGAEIIAQRLRNRPEGLVIGGNIGKNKMTSNEDAARDYLDCFNILFDVVDYFVVNVSSPNTPGLRELQQKGPLRDLLSQLQLVNKQHDSPKPLLLKISPDLDEGQLDDVIDISLETGIEGIVATNTTIFRQGLVTGQNDMEKIGAGGLSGKPLRKKSTEMIRYIRKKAGDRLVIMAVGGVFSTSDALEKLEAGASAVQLYTGFIYEGPAIVRKICAGLPAS